MFHDFSERIRSIPVLRVLLCAIAGSLAGHNFEVPAMYLLPVIFVLFLFLLLIYRFNLFFNLHNAWIRGVIISLLFTSLFWYRTMSGRSSPRDLAPDARFAEVCSLPAVKSKTICFKLKIPAGWQKEKTGLAGKIYALAYFPQNDTLLSVRPGDVILFHAPLKVPVNAGNPDEFDYAGYLKGKGIYYRTFIREGHYRWLTQERNDLRSVPLNIKRRLLQRIDDTPGDLQARAILAAVTLGTRDQLDPELKNTWANAGGIHVMAVSGLHVGMLWMFIAWMTGFMGRKRAMRIIRFGLITGILWMYALITGMSSSVTRAGLMFTLVSLGKLINRNTDSFNTVLASAFLQLAADPGIFYDTGFRFSYLAVLGILLFHDLLTGIIPVKGYLPQKIRDLAAVSISAQILTFPLGIMYFHQFPTWFLLTNFFIIPLVTVVVLTYLVSVLCFFVPPLSFLLTKLCILLTDIMNQGVNAVDKLPGGVIGNLTLTPFQVCILLSIPLIFRLFLAYKKYSLLIAFQSLILLFILSGIVRRMREPEGGRLTIYNIGKLPAIGIAEGKDHYMLTDTSVAEFDQQIGYAAASFWINHYLDEPVFLDVHALQHSPLSVYTLPGSGNFVLMLDHCSLVCLADNGIFSTWNANHTYHCDFLLITGRTLPAADHLVRLFSPDTLIITSSVDRFSDYHRIDQKYLPVIHDVRSSGSFSFCMKQRHVLKKTESFGLLIR